jgi:uncharacterized protein (TIGR02466 family)
MNDLLFTVPVSHKHLNLNTTELVSFAYDLKTKDTGRVLSNLGGWQSNNVDLTDLTLQPLCIEILKFAKDYCHLVSFKKNLQILLINGWFNINGYRDYNKTHDHPGCVISGVYYLQSSKDSGGITFYNPSNIMDWSWPDYIKEKYSTINSNTYSYSSIINTLILFPSWLKHSVQPNMDKQMERISFSFNISVTT